MDQYCIIEIMETNEQSGINEELHSYVKQAREAGMADDEIRRNLLASGWPESVINSYFNNNLNNKENELLSATRLLEGALKRLKERFKIAFQIILIPLILYTPYVFYVDFGSSIIFSIVSIIVTFFFVLSSLMAGIALIYIFGKDEKLGFLEYLKLGANKLRSYIWIAIIYDFIILGGYILLIVPGIMFSVWFSMAFYALILEDKKGMEAMIRSRELLRGKFWAVVWRFIFLGLAILVILLPFIIIDLLLEKDLSWLISIFSFIIMPLGVAYHVTFFKNLAQVKKESFVYDKKSARKFIVAGLTGILLLVSLMALGGYYYFTKLKPLLQTPTLNTAPIYDLTADWQTYRSEEYGFEFKYPGNFNVEDTDIAPPGEVFLYNYRYDFYPQYKGGPGGLTRYSNFSLLFDFDSVSPEYFQSGQVKTYQKTIGSNVYTVVDLSPDFRREARYFLKVPNDAKHIQIIYRPTLDIRDIGGLVNEPDYVAGVDAIRNNPNFLDENQQRIILDQILSTFKFIEPSTVNYLNSTAFRDRQRFADVLSFWAPLELYFDDNKNYPENLEQLKPKYTHLNLLAPTPPDGKCTASDNSYNYTSLNNGKIFSLSFCLGEAFDSKKAYFNVDYKLNPGIHFLDPSGIK